MSQEEIMAQVRASEGAQVGMDADFCVAVADEGAHLGWL